MRTPATSIEPMPPAALPGAKLLKKFDQNFCYKKLLPGVQGGGFLEKSPPGNG